MFFIQTVPLSCPVTEIKGGLSSFFSSGLDPFTVIAFKSRAQNTECREERGTEVVDNYYFAMKI